MNQWKALPSWLIQQASLPSSVVYFFPLLSFLSSWSLLFPLSTAFLTVLSSCQGNESESPLSATTLFLCLTLPFSASVRSSFGLHPTVSAHFTITPLSPSPAAYDVTPGAKAVGKWPEVGKARVQRAFLGVVNCSFFPIQESASLVWRKCLLFQEVCPALLKSFKVAPWFPIFLLS